MFDATSPDKFTSNAYLCAHCALNLWTEGRVPAGRPSQGEKGQQPLSKKPKGSRQLAKKGQASFGATPHHGSGKPAQGPLPAALEKTLPPYDRLEGIIDAALPTHQQVIRPPPSLLSGTGQALQAFQRKQDLK